MSNPQAASSMYCESCCHIILSSWCPASQGDNYQDSFVLVVSKEYVPMEREKESRTWEDKLLDSWNGIGCTGLFFRHEWYHLRYQIDCQLSGPTIALTFRKPDMSDDSLPIPLLTIDRSRVRARKRRINHHHTWRCKCKLRYQRSPPYQNSKFSRIRSCQQTSAAIERWLCRLQSWNILLGKLFWRPQWSHCKRGMGLSKVFVESLKCFLEIKWWLCNMSVRYVFIFWDVWRK